MPQILGKAGSALLQSGRQPGRARAAGNAFGACAQTWLGQNSSGACRRLAVEGRNVPPATRTPGPSEPRPATSHKGDSFACSVCLYLCPFCCSRYADLYLGDIWNKLEKGLREVEGEVRRQLLPGLLGCVVVGCKDVSASKAVWGLAR